MQRDWGAQSIEQESLEALEKNLAAVLQPAAPRPGFIRELKERLYLENGVEVLESRARSLAAPLVILAASLVSGTFLVVVGIKGVKHWKSVAALSEKGKFAAPAG
jgi:hypothetical protein